MLSISLLNPCMLRQLDLVCLWRPSFFIEASSALEFFKSLRILTQNDSYVIICYYVLFHRNHLISIILKTQCI